MFTVLECLGMSERYWDEKMVHQERVVIILEGIRNAGVDVRSFERFFRFRKAVRFMSVLLGYIER